jgi:hypothetical protein
MTAAPIGISAAALLFAPVDLIEVDQWVLWRRERDTKVPYQPNGKRASSTDLKTWRPYQDVYNAWQKYPRHWAGIGFVFSEHDPFAGIDLDACLDCVGNLRAWARPIIERFADTYMEISPSGTGIKIWCKGKLPAAVRAKVEEGAIEIYDRGRYFTVTGNQFRGKLDTVEDHAADLMTLYERLSGRHGEYQMPQYGIGPEGKIPKGTQHLTLVSLAGTLRRRGVCDEAIAACLQEVNRHQCEQPGPPENISRIVRSSRPWRRP